MRIWGNGWPASANAVGRIGGGNPLQEQETNASSPRAGLVFDDRYLQHNPGPQVLAGSGRPLPFVDLELHRSNHLLVQRAKQLIDLGGLEQKLVHIPACDATPEQIAVYHTEDYIGHVKDISDAGGGDAGEGAALGPGSYEIALRAAGGGLAAVDAVMSGAARRVFALVRPPGHHAMSDKGMGFCLFNNVVVAAHYAHEVHQLERVMILDWDVHHGNGTQDAFYHDPSTLFVSIHEDQLYPVGWGAIDQSGEGDGQGFTVNIPLPSGSGDATYEAAFERIVLPIVDEYQPEMIFVSAGQDASIMDPLGRMSLSTDAYRRMTSLMINRAERHAGGQLVILQEGGYSEVYAPYCTMAIVETLAGSQTNLTEPITLDRLTARPSHSQVGLDAEDALRRISEHQSQFWTNLR